MQGEDRLVARLSIDLCGIRLRNPTVLASGILGTTRELVARVARAGAGAVTIKSISREPRGGHNNPCIVTFEAGMMNAVGYSNPGLDEALEEFADLSEVPAPVIASVIGRNPEEFAEVAGRLAELPFAAVELPLSCPHTPGYGTLAGQGTPEATGRITAAVREVTDKPIFVKVSPNIPALGDTCRAAEANGASAITAVNSLGPGMLINIEAREAVLDFKMGGVTGAALRPVATRCVYDIYEAVDLPILGTGGVSTGRHAVELIMAGATAVGIGTAVYERGMDVFETLVDEMAEWMDANGVSRVEELIGAAHHDA
jgi:dihydroorotate dehydrogenase (NAD+) catalytic subunit